VSRLKLVRRPVGNGNHVMSWISDPDPWEFTPDDVAREAAVLDQLADETDRTNPLTAARNLFGGGA